MYYLLIISFLSDSAFDFNWSIFSVFCISVSFVKLYMNHPLVSYLLTYLKPFNAIIKMTIALFKSVSLLVKEVYIVIETMILFFGLDKSSHNFFNVLNACGFFDLFKSILYYSWISHILI
jgi:hypothetical protein